MAWRPLSHFVHTERAREGQAKGITCIKASLQFSKHSFISWPSDRHGLCRGSHGLLERGLTFLGSPSTSRMRTTRLPTASGSS